MSFTKTGGLVFESNIVPYKPPTFKRPFINIGGPENLKRNADYAKFLKTRRNIGIGAGGVLATGLGLWGAHKLYNKLIGSDKSKQEVGTIE